MGNITSKTWSFFDFTVKRGMRIWPIIYAKRTERSLHILKELNAQIASELVEDLQKTVNGFQRRNCVFLLW